MKVRLEYSYLSPLYRFGFNHSLFLRYEHTHQLKLKESLDWISTFCTDLWGPIGHRWDLILFSQAYVVLFKDNADATLLKLSFPDSF